MYRSLSGSVNDRSFAGGVLNPDKAGCLGNGLFDSIVSKLSQSWSMLIQHFASHWNGWYTLIDDVIKVERFHEHDSDLSRCQLSVTSQVPE